MVYRSLPGWASLLLVTGITTYSCGSLSIYDKYITNTLSSKIVNQYKIYIYQLDNLINYK